MFVGKTHAASEPATGVRDKPRSKEEIAASKITDGAEIRKVIKRRYWEIRRRGSIGSSSYNDGAQDAMWGLLREIDGKNGRLK